MVYPDEVRTAELAASVSFAADIGVGQPLEHGLRTCLLALRLADCMGLSEADRRATYYVALLRWAGCTSDARVLSEWFGNDIAARRNA